MDLHGLSGTSRGARLEWARPAGCGSDGGERAQSVAASTWTRATSAGRGPARGRRPVAPALDFAHGRAEEVPERARPRAAGRPEPLEAQRQALVLEDVAPDGKRSRPEGVPRSRAGEAARSRTRAARGASSPDPPGRWPALRRTSRGRACGRPLGAPPGLDRGRGAAERGPRGRTAEGRARGSPGGARPRGGERAPRPSRPARGQHPRRRERGGAPRGPRRGAPGGRGGIGPRAVGPARRRTDGARPALPRGRRRPLARRGWRRHGGTDRALHRRSASPPHGADGAPGPGLAARELRDAAHVGGREARRERGRMRPWDGRSTASRETASGVDAAPVGPRARDPSPTAAQPLLWDVRSLRPGSWSTRSRRARPARTATNWPAREVSRSSAADSARPASSSAMEAGQLSSVRRPSSAMEPAP